MKSFLITSALLLTTGAYAQDCTDAAHCTKCQIMQTVNYQFNALRLGEVKLPTTVDGKTLTWRYDHPAQGVQLTSDRLKVSQLPDQDYQPAGTLVATTSDETLTFPLTLAPDDHMYGYLYCHMAGTSENTLYAIGTKDDRGVKFQPLINNQPIYDPSLLAGIEGGVRDAFILRAADGNGYLMATTDMSNAKSRTWFNYGINLMRSNDLVHWTSVTFDFRKGSSIFSDPDSRDVYKDWTKINRVWAPQMIWDANYNNGEGGYFVYYSMLSTNEGDDHDRIYYSYANRDFTTLTKPQLLHDRGIAMIDCHIDWNDCDRLYHVFYKREGADAFDRGIYKATFAHLGDNQWRDILHITNEGKSQCEGGSAFRLINENQWRVAYINYSVRPKRYKVCSADALITHIDEGELIQGDVNPQHGSFMTLTRDEYDMLQAWSDLTLRVQQLEADPRTARSARVRNARRVLQQTYASDAVPQLLKLYRTTLKKL